MTKKIIGYIKQEIIDTIQISIYPNTPIIIGDTNIDHMRSSHPEDFSKYFGEIEEIINNPDYLGVHPSNGSIQFIKQYYDNEKEDYVLVAARASSKGTIYYAKTLFIMNDDKVLNYMNNSYMVKYKK